MDVLSFPASDKRTIHGVVELEVTVTDTFIGGSDGEKVENTTKPGNTRDDGCNGGTR